MKGAAGGVTGEGVIGVPGESVIGVPGEGVTGALRAFILAFTFSGTA